ncbi:MAG TPA: response regulator [Ramlibacter sp.]|nr:response regulator [Ramlibacter sp.]
MKGVRRLYEHYSSYHLHGPLMLRYLSIMGFAAFPLFYLLRFTKSVQPYDDWAIRLVDAVLCLVLFLKDRWPKKLKRYYFAYSYVVLTVTLPLTFVFTSLKQGGGSVAVGNTLMAVFLVILLTDWRNTIAVVVTGFAAAILLYVGTDADPRMPADYLARLPILVAVLVGGCLFKLAAERATAEKVRSAYVSLAASIAHEMRNPLGQLRHSLQDMKEAMPPPTTGGQAQMLDGSAVDALYRQLAEGELAVQRGLQVISMTLQEVNAKPMDTEGFAHLSAADATRKAVQEFSYEDDVARRSVDVEVREDFSFRGDETAYLFVLFNLVKNALYYLPQYPGTRVAITVGGHQVKVRDNGPGIAPKLLPGLFEPFRSVGKSGGTGLGLAYCQRVMRAFGGTIACQSVAGEFTEFTLSFPPVGQEDSQANRFQVLAQARTTFQGRRLLLVDDDTAQRIATRHKLQPLAVTIDEAPDGQRALELLAQTRYDLVLLDLNMPVLDGYALAGQIRGGRVPANRDVPIVAHTSEPAHLAGVKARKAGMDGLASKPCDQLLLVRIMCQALEHAAARVALGASMLAGRTVLVADDSTWNRKAVAAHLKLAGAEVVEARHGQQVLELLRGGGTWDAVVMDINMPGMDGLATARAIRASALACAGVPIIALSAHSDEAAMGAARAAGMNDYLSKPVDVLKLYALLRRLMGDAMAAGLPAPPARPPAADAAPGLLDAGRLESYIRLGMFDELLGDYLPEMARLVDRLESSAARHDLQACLDALHSLLGMSGEAGAAALHQLVRSVYVPMVEDRCWPTATGWPQQIRTLAVETERALRGYGAPSSSSPTH